MLPLARAIRYGLRADRFFDRWPRLLRPFTLSLVTAPVLSVALLQGTWHGPEAVVAVVAFALAIGHGVLAQRSRATPEVFAALTLAAAALTAMSAGYAFGVTPLDGRMLGSVVALGAGIVTLGRRDRQSDLVNVGHAVALASAFLLLVHLFVLVGSPWGRLNPLGAGALVRESLGAALAALALGTVGFRSDTPTTARTVYLTAAHLVVVLWIRMLLRPLDNGTFYTSAVWGVYGIGLVVVGLRMRDDLVRQIGLGTVLATVLKVLLFDLAAVPGLWRVLLFMGLGALLLVVSYLVPSILRGATAPLGPTEAEAGRSVP